MKRIYFSAVFLVIFTSGKISGQCLETIAEPACTSAFFVIPNPPTKNCKNVLYYDFSEGNFIYQGSPVNKLSEVKASYGKEFRVVVLNINRYNYDIEIALDNISFGSEQPELFQKLFLGEGGYITGLIDKIKLSDNEYFMGVPGTSEDKLIADLKSFLNEYYSLIDKQVSAYDYCPPKPGKPASGSNDFNLTYFTKKLLDLKINFDIQINELSASLSKNEVNLKSAEACLSGCLSNKADLESKLKKLEGNKGTRAEEEREKIEADLQKLQCEKYKKEIDSILAQKKSLENFTKKLEEIWEMVSGITNKDLIRLTHFQRNYIMEHFMYVSPPVYPDGNMLRINLKFSPADSSQARRLNIMPLRNDSLSIDLFVKNKVYFSFSSGPFAGIGGALWNDAYGWKPQPDTSGNVNDTSRYQLVNGGKSKGMAGIAAFADIGLKFCEWFGMSLSTGVGISIESSPRPSYLVGLSLNFGKRQVLSLKGGYMITYADRLNTQLYPDLSETTYDMPSPISYTREPVNGGFISLTYTFFTLNKQQGVKSGGNH